jgi:hypothetical protein
LQPAVPLWKVIVGGDASTILRRAFVPGAFFMRSLCGELRANSEYGARLSIRHSLFAGQFNRADDLDQIF